MKMQYPAGGISGGHFAVGKRGLSPALNTYMFLLPAEGMFLQKQ